MATKEQLYELDAMAKPRSNEAIARANERKKQRSKMLSEQFEKKYKLTDETIGLKITLGLLMVELNYLVIRLTLFMYISLRITLFMWEEH